MATKKNYIKNATLKFQTGSIGIILKYKSGKINSGDLPFKSIIVDKDSLEELECNLIEILPLPNFIPSILLHISEGEYGPETEQDLLDRFNINNHPYPLAFYLYEPVK